MASQVPSYLGFSGCAIDKLLDGKIAKVIQGEMQQIEPRGWDGWNWNGGQGVGCGGARGCGWIEATLECEVQLEIVGEMHGVLKADLETEVEVQLRLCQSWR